MDRDWEPLLYAKMFDYDILPSLPSFTRVSVEGTVHMVICIHVLENYYFSLLCIDLNFSSKLLLLLFTSYS